LPRRVLFGALLNVLVLQRTDTPESKELPLSALAPVARTESETAAIPAARRVRPNVALAKALGEARAVGVPGWAVAAEAGISPSLLSMITRGGARVTEANALAIARALGRSAGELFPAEVRKSDR
jgi:hypothetical protein